MVVHKNQEVGEAMSIAGGKIALRPPDAATAAGVSLSKIYLEMRAGNLRARKMGGVTVILVTDLQAWLEALPVKDPISLPHRERMKRQWAAKRQAEAQAK